MVLPSASHFGTFMYGQKCSVRGRKLAHQSAHFLMQEVEMYDTYERRITECDQQLQKHLASFSKTILSSPPEAEPKRKRSKPAKNAPQFELRSELQRITGVDLTRIDGIDVMVAQTLVSEIGLDMSR
jgi:transposase